MKQNMLTLLAMRGLMAVLGAAPAFAQMPNMDMSWAINQQMRLQQQGDNAAMNAASAYYNYMVRLRQMGYTGPSLATGVTPQSLQNSIRGAQNAMDAYNHASQVNSNRTSNAVSNWDYRAVRSCSIVVDVYGYQRWVCP
jgi:hypothetical protein